MPAAHQPEIMGDFKTITLLRLPPFMIHYNSLINAIVMPPQQKINIHLKSTSYEILKYFKKKIFAVLKIYSVGFMETRFYRGFTNLQKRNDICSSEKLTGVFHYFYI